MKYSPIASSLFQFNRKRFVAQLSPKAIALLNANDIMPTNADGTMSFRQNNDLFYLTGIDQEETVLLLFPDAHNPKDREVLFVKETSELIAIWEGHKLSKEQATAHSAITEVRWLSELEATMRRLIPTAEIIYLNQNEHSRASKEVETRDDRCRKSLMQQYPLHQYGRIAPIMQQLRLIKSDEEIKQMRHACGITEKHSEGYCPSCKQAKENTK